MGRKKLSMVPIIDNQKRKVAFKTRKPGLIKKARELSTLCDVCVSMIIFSDLLKNKREVFPSDDPHTLNASINAYKSKGASETYGLGDVLKDMKQKAEDELAKAKKRNSEAKYPTWFGGLDYASEAELRNFNVALGQKMEKVIKRIEFLRKVSKPMTMMRPVGYKDYAFDHVGHCDLSKPISMMDMLLQNEDEKENPNSIITSEGDSSCFDGENFGLAPLPLAMVLPEDLPLVDMDSFFGSSVPSEVLDYETSGYKYLG